MKFAHMVLFVVRLSLLQLLVQRHSRQQMVQQLRSHQRRNLQLKVLQMICRSNLILKGCIRIIMRLFLYFEEWSLIII